MVHDGDGPLVGREADLDRIGGFIASVALGAGPLLLLGESGVGKTALLTAGAAQAEESGMCVLRIAGVQYKARLSYSGVRQLLDAAVAAQPSVVLGGPLAVVTGHRSGPAPERDAVAEALLALVRQLAWAKPTLLVVDDLQWLDSASAVVLGQMAHRLSGSKAGMLAAARPGMESFFDYSGLPAHEVAPLSDAAAEALLVRRFPAMALRVRRRLMAEAQGNPLALLELPVALSDSQRTADEALPERLPLSRRLQSAFAGRITGLPAATRYLLLLAALDGTGDLKTLRRAAAGRCSLKNLAPAERTQLVYVDDPSSLRFRHSLTLSAVVELATGEQRRGAHQDLARAWQDVPERQAWHLAHAAAAPDEQVAALIEQVADTIARRGDGPAAVAALLRAAQLSPAGPDQGRRLAQAAYVSANIGGELHDVPRLLDVARRAAPGDESLAAAVAGSIYLLNGSGDIDTAHRLLCGAIAMQPRPYDPADATLCEAMFALMLVCFFGGRPGLWKKFDAALDGFASPPDQLRLLRATVGDPARVNAADLAELDAVIAGLAGESDPTRIVRIGLATIYVDRLSGVTEALHRVVAGGHRGENVAPAMRALFMLGIHAWMTGQWPQARQFAREAVDLCDHYRYPMLASPAQFLLACVAAASGDYAQAAGLADQIERWAGPRRADAVRAYATQIRALIALGRGEFEEAYQHAAKISPPGRLPPFSPQAVWEVMDLVDAAVRTGRRTEAFAHATAIRAVGLDAVSPRMRMLVHASAALAAEDEDAARCEFDEALSVEGAERWPFSLARVRLYYGERLRRGNAPAEARGHLVAAADIFARLGAMPWSDRANQELRACGTPGRTPARPAGAELTPQQWEIAKLAASGLTNKQIGERLFLSPRTVSSHLYQVFPKLGITSRAALRDALEQLGADAPE